MCFVIKLTFHDWWGRLTTLAVAAVFIVLSCSFAVEQSRTRIAEWLDMPDLMLDTSVILTVDVFFQIAFCVLMAKKLAGALSRRENIMLQVALWFPGLLIFPVMFSLLVDIVFNLPGIDFDMIGWGVAAGVPVVAIVMSVAVKWLMPEDDIRLELMFFINLIIAALGVVATVNGRTAAEGTDSVDWTASAAVLSILIAGAAAGLPLYSFMLNRKIAKIKLRS